MERYNLFIQTTPAYFQDKPDFQQTPTLELSKITVRRERQTFRRLPRSGVVLFTVRTYMIPLLSLRMEDVKGLRSQIRCWAGEMGMYKGVGTWGQLVQSWCDEVLGENCVDE